jgi:hypothetical protein
MISAPSGETSKSPITKLAGRSVSWSSAPVTFNPLFPSGYYFTTAGYTTYANLVHAKTDLSLNPLTNLKLTSGLGVEWRETVADAIYTLPDVPVPDTPGRGGRYVGTYGQFRADCGLTPHIALALEAVHFLAGATIVSVGGHDTNYLGAEVRYGWRLASRPQWYSPCTTPKRTTELFTWHIEHV